MKRTIVATCTFMLAACAGSPATTGPSAEAAIRPASGSQVHGVVKFTEVGNAVRVNAELAAVPSGLTTLRTHEKRDCSAADAASAGVLEREIGPLYSDEYGKATGTYTMTGTSVSKNTGGLIGKGVIIQNGKDRVGCGTIE